MDKDFDRQMALATYINEQCDEVSITLGQGIWTVEDGHNRAEGVSATDANLYRALCDYLDEATALARTFRMAM